MSISYEGIGEWCATFGCGAVSGSLQPLLFP